jgi:translation initiation factor 1
MTVRPLDPIDVSNDFDDVTGLPEELGIGDDLASAEQRVTIRVDTRRYGKSVTVVEGFDPSAVDLDDLGSKLKSTLAVGGTVEDGRIELQGEHDERLREALEAEGFQVDG